jgi:hypothetical protein
MRAITQLGDLTPDPRNARRHTPRNVGAIEQALREVGAARSIVIDEAGTVLAGNATIEAAAQAGIERVQVVDADGETLIAVRRTGLTPEQKTRLALFDNRAAELAEWEPAVLAELADSGVDLSGLWSDRELAILLELGEAPDPAALWQGMPEFEHEDLTATAAFTIRVFLKDADDLVALGRLLGKDLTGRKFVWFGKQPHGTTYEVIE